MGGQPKTADLGGRASTGVPGLDEVLFGGLFRGRLYLIEGGSGTGKTTVALQFLLEGVRRGESGLYVSFSESELEARADAESHGWSLDGLSILQVATADTVLLQEEENTLFQPSEVELGERMRNILEAIEREHPQRLVIDSCAELRLLSRTPLRFRRQMLALKQKIAEAMRTVLVIDMATGDEILESLAHGVLQLEQLSPLYGAERRRMRVLKMRGTTYQGGYHDFRIRQGGIEVFPRLVAAETPPKEFEPGIVLTGIAEIDALLGGGAQRGTSLLVTGPSGVGKSMLATQYALAAAVRGERVAYFTFDETRNSVLERARGAGLDLRPHIASRRILLKQVDPAELSPGHFVHILRDEVALSTRLIIIDSLDGYIQSMPGEGFLQLQLHEMLTFLNLRGVLTLLISSQRGVIGEALATSLQTSYLADTLVVLRYFEAGGELHRAISVIKKRSGSHESAIRELRINDNGLHVGQSLHQFRGILTGVPSYEGGTRGPGKMLREEK